MSARAGSKIRLNSFTWLTHKDSIFCISYLSQDQIGFSGVLKEPGRGVEITHSLSDFYIIKVTAKSFYHRISVIITVLSISGTLILS